MTLNGAMLCLLCSLAVEIPDSAADALTLRDGQVVLGQRVKSSATNFNQVKIYVRRDWAETHLQDRFNRWEEIERPWRIKALEQRLQRLEAWQHDLQTVGNGVAQAQDQLSAWLDRQIESLRREPLANRPPLLMAVLDRREVAEILERSAAEKRMLRQAWRAGFEDAETMPVDRLQAGLQARGFALNAIDPAPIDDLLPLPLESDRRWLARRASTEVLQDPGLRFIQFQHLVLPEQQFQGEAPAIAAGPLLSTLGNLLGEGPRPDPLAEQRQRIEAQGRIGMVLTDLKISPDFSTLRVESALHVRTAPGRWEVAARRSATVRPGDLPADAGEPLAADPQVQAAFRMFEGFGLGPVDPQARQLSLKIGAATRLALRKASAALQTDLESAALRVD